jgi:molecular chaperone IbpA
MQLDYREFVLLTDVELHPNQNRHLLKKGWFSKGRQLFGALVSMLLHEEDMAMSNTLDFAPLFRSTIGFDRILDTLESASRLRSIDTWPPYDIVRKSEDDYRISMAVAGLTENDLTITQEQNMLLVAGRRSSQNGESGQYLHRGIAARDFQRRFQLADHVKVVDASLVNGLLTIDLKRELPEEMKPRRIAIAAGEALPKVETKQIQPEKQAA